MNKSSRISGFYKLPVEERLSKIGDWSELSPEEHEALSGVRGLSPKLADKLIENVVGVFGLPIGVAANFMINGRDVLIPMVVEEPSIVAGASFMAKLARDGGGFRTSSTSPHMIGQIQILDLEDLDKASRKISDNKDFLLKEAGKNSFTMINRGGGPQDIEIRQFLNSPVGPMLVVHLIFDCRDAMGANMINTACETLAPALETITGGRVGLKILSNLADKRTARAECKIPASSLSFNEFSGEQVIDGIIEAWAFAVVDPYRATTHNKGIMNGIDPIIIATGNDWRAVEAGAHAYAARNGQYTSLSTWQKDDEGNLVGSLELPMALGIVGGSTRVHLASQVALKILDVKSASELAEIVVAVGLAQNLAALRALATEGIQKGHMTLHARQIAVSAGAEGTLVDKVAERMLKDENITLTFAQKLVEQLQQ